MTIRTCGYTSLLLASFFLFSCSQEKRTTPEGFQIEPGFDLTLVASEPLIKDPVDLEFNEQGDAYSCFSRMLGYWLYICSTSFKGTDARGSRIYSGGRKHK